MALSATCIKEISLKDLPLDTRAIPQNILNIGAKTRSNLFAWNGQFSPQLVQALLDTFANSRDFVLDPFLGSGTVLVESGRKQLPAFGVEINPAAFKMAALYRLVCLAVEDRKHLLENCRSLLLDHLPDDFFMPAGTEPNGPEVRNAVVALSRNTDDACVKGLLEALIVRLDFHANDLSVSKVLSIWGRLEQTALNLPFSPQQIDCAHADARCIPLPDETADLVVTSPPYINVFNYHQQYRHSAELLGWDLLRVAKSEIGANRKHRGNRFLTVVQYCLDMADVLRELRRVCKPRSRVILVVGRESNVRKTRFLNAEIVTQLAVACGRFSLALRQERVFTNKFGIAIWEEILHLVPNDEMNDAICSPLDIAKHALVCARAGAPSESLADLECALQQAEAIKPSPLFVADHRVGAFA